MNIIIPIDENPGDRSLVLPKTVQELETDLCPLLLEASDKIKSGIRNCLDPFPKTVAGLVVRGTRKVIRKQCSDEQQKKDIVRHLVCLQDKSRLDQMHDVVDMFNRKLVIIGSDAVPINKRLDVLCCSEPVLIKDLLKVFQQWPDCKPEGIAWALKLVNDMLKDALDLACSTYQSSPDKCTAVLESTPLNVTIQSPKNNDAFFVPLIHVLSTIS